MFRGRGEWIAPFYAKETNRVPTLHLVRHGRAVAGFDAHRDPDLDEAGRGQAQAAADALATELPTPLPIFTSPLARARQTAEPLAERWRVEAVVEPRIAEIPTPVVDLRARGAWLRGALAGRWTDLPAAQRRWREEVVRWASETEADAVAFCHFIPINALVGAAQGAERLIVFRPDNGSITRIDVRDGALRVVALGREAATRVN